MTTKAEELRLNHRLTEFHINATEDPTGESSRLFAWITDTGELAFDTSATNALNANEAATFLQWVSYWFTESK